MDATREPATLQGLAFLFDPAHTVLCTDCHRVFPRILTIRRHCPPCHIARVERCVEAFIRLNPRQFSSDAEDYRASLDDENEEDEA